MRFLSVCSGIEAASVAWHPLGWRAWAYSEIEPFPCAVLAHHYPDTPNLGDMTKFKDWPDGSIDLLCGGTPCQSFSNAGLRAGLDDPRGQLMLTFGAIAARYRPRWLVWENVPGVLSSNGGRDFGAFLGLLGHLGYGFAYRVLDAQFVRVDGYARAVPQRRQRVFVVGCLGDWRSAAAVLLERESLRGDSAPRRSAGTRVTTCLDASPDIGGDGSRVSRLVTGVDYTNGLIQGDISGTLEHAQHKGNRGQGVLAYGGNRTTGPRSVASALSAHGGASGRMDFESETFVAHTLRGEGFDASEDGTGRGTPLVPVHAPDVHPTMVARSSRGGGQTNTPGHNADETLLAFHGSQDPDVSGAVTHPVGRNQGQETCAMVGAAVRRLMPVECERLQGFQDGYTAIPWRGKPASECPDGQRYKALGNSWAVNAARWVGARIAAVDQINQRMEIAA